ncbi:hypothetical protein HMPREF0043_01979 [Actinobaculum sp. oral taxon 183 str. F0552]|nr:hypothetical protein HMPREF0043_01979 [Actinobaculum sp. oral taxon 183 str. F0552]
MMCVCQLQCSPFGEGNFKDKEWISWIVWCRGCGRCLSRRG